MAKPIDPRDPSKVLLNIYSTLSSPNVVNNIPNTNILYGDGLFVKAENSQSIKRGTGSYIKLQFKRVAGKAPNQTITYTDIATINYNTQDGHQTYHVTSPMITIGSVYLEISIFLKYNGTTNFDSIFSQSLFIDFRGKEMDISFDWYGLNQETGKEVGIKNIMMINKTTSDTGDFSFNAVYSPIAVGRDINSDTSADLLGECIQFSRDRICDVNVNINVEGYNENWVYEIPFFNNISQQYSINQCVRYADLDMSNSTVVDKCVIYYKTTDNNALGYVGKTIGTSGGTNVTVDADIYSSSYYGRLLYSQPIDYIESGRFRHYTNLKDITIPIGVTRIVYETFYGCSGLTSVTIPNSVTSIGESAFHDCSSLISVNIPSSVTSIGDHAFYDCSGLTSVTIPNSVTSIGISAFFNCSSLTSVNIPSSVTSIETSTFSSCSSLTSVIIGNSVTSIGISAFANCSSLTYIVIPNSVTSIGERAFGDCTRMISVSIGNSVTSIGSSAFFNCSSLTSVTIPNSVTNIGDGAFWNCNSMTSVTIGNSVTSIGDGAFWSCSSLTSVTIPNSVTSIGSVAFMGCSNMTSVIYNGVTYTSRSLLESSLTNNGVSVKFDTFYNTGLQA